MRFSCLIPLMLTGCGVLSAGNAGDPSMLSLAIQQGEGVVEAVSRDHQVYRFALPDLQEKGRKPLTSGKARAVALSPDGKFIVTADSTGMIRWGPLSGPFREVHQTKAIITGLAVRGDHIAALSTEDRILVLDVEGKLSSSISGGKDHFAPALAFAPDQDVLVAGLGNIDGPAGPAVRTFDVATGKVLKTFGPNGCVTSLAYSPDGKFLLAAGAAGGTVEDPSFLAVVDAKAETVLAEFIDKRPHQSYRAVAFDGSTIICATYTGALRAFTFKGNAISPR